MPCQQNKHDYKGEQIIIAPAGCDLASSKRGRAELINWFNIDNEISCIWQLHLGDKYKVLFYGSPWKLYISSI